MSIPKKVLQALCIGVLSFFEVKASFALVITSPQNGQAFKEGDTVKIVAELSPDDPDILHVSFGTTGGLADCDDIATHPHYECSFVIPPASPKVIEIYADAPTPERDIVNSQIIAISVSLPPTVTLKGLKSSDPNGFFIYKLGQKKQLYITGVYSDGVDRDIDGSASGTTYQSSDPNVVTVDPEGLVTAVGGGKAIITVKNGDKSLQIEARIPVIQSIVITPKAVSLFLTPDMKRSLQLTVTGLFSDGLRRSIEKGSKGTTYQSSDETVVTVNSQGRLTAVAVGKANVVVTNGGKTAQVSVEVKAAP